MHRRGRVNAVPVHLLIEPPPSVGGESKLGRVREQPLEQLPCIEDERRCVWVSWDEFGLDSGLEGLVPCLAAGFSVFV